jgi:hypothetical protein
MPVGKRCTMGIIGILDLNAFYLIELKGMVQLIFRVFVNIYMASGIHWLKDKKTALPD